MHEKISIIRKYTRMRTTIRSENLNWCFLGKNYFWTWIIRIMTLWHRQILALFGRTSPFSSKFICFDYRYDLNWIKWLFSSATNVVSSTMMIILNIFNDFKLLFRVQSAVENAANSTSKLSFNIKTFEKQSFMLSMYVETFRLFVQIFVTRCSSHTIVHINNWLFSKNKISMMSFHSTHMNAEIWNIKGDVHFLDKFWAKRFLIDFNDSENDSIKMNVIGHESADSKKLIYSMDEVRFFFEDLEGSWIPYEDKSSFCSLHVHNVRLTTLQTSIQFVQKNILSNERFSWHARWWFSCSRLKF